MRFYFDIKDGVPVRDKAGREFAHVSEAIEYSRSYAHSLRNSGVRRDTTVAVVNENGSLIHEERVYDQSGV